MNPEVPEQDRPTRVEDLDDATELWPSGPSAGQVKYWKSLHRDAYVTSVTADQHFVWRPLARSEYVKLVKSLADLATNAEFSKKDIEFLNEELITQVCLLFPTPTEFDFRNGPAGLPSLLSQEILEASGFKALEIRQL